MPVEALISSLGQLYPPGRLLTRPAELIPYESDALTAFRTRPQAVVLAESQDEVVETVRLCHRMEVPFVARGSGTSLSGGSMPVAEGIVIGLNRLKRVLKLDPASRIAMVEPGAVNLDVSRAAALHNLYYAPDPSSQPICTIGGNVAFNSGGAHCLKYGMTSNHVLGIKAVLADGQVVHLGGSSVEGVGPDLPGLFVGSEGLFGIALEITLRLLPKVETYRTVLAAYRSLEAAGDAVGQVVASGLLPGAMEIMDRLAIDAAEASVQAGYPRDAQGLLIVELEGEIVQVEAEFADLLAVIERSGAYEFRTAQDEDERTRIWKGRKGAFSAVGRLSPNYIVQDGVVPRSRLGEALAEIERLSGVYGLRVANVFHAGDGNLHPLILYNGQVTGELERAEGMAGEILQLCIHLGGSITGEHGIGVEKRQYLPAMFSGVDMITMQRLRVAMDPKELANRGKMLPVGQTSSVPVSAGDGPTSHRSQRPTLQPSDVDQVVDAVRGYPRLLARGGGSKPSLSTPWVDDTPVLDLRNLCGIVEYEPAEFTFTALAGTALAEIQALLAKNGQYLPFDPPLADRGATLGGTVAAGLSGPGRYRFGGLRDFILGVRFVDGMGNLIRGGGKVVKNAAGFDLPKLMVGSLGSLGVLTEVTFKVFPQPPAYATLHIDYPDLASALSALARLARAPLDIEAVDLEPMATGTTSLWVRIGGLAELIDRRLGRLQSLLGEGTEVTGQTEAALWQGLRDFLWAPDHWSLVKVPVTPRHLARLDEDLEGLGVQRRYSVGGNVAWLASPLAIEQLDDLLSEHGLAALVLRGPKGPPFLGAWKANAFARRVKRVLDPEHRYPDLHPGDEVTS